MREFQAKRRFRNILYSKGMVIALIVLVAFLAKATWNVYLKQKESAENAAQASRELAKLKDREQLLKGEIERLSTNEGIEEEIRSKYSVSKPGEKLLVIVDTQATATPSVESPESWWEKFKKLFK